jgi:hypothetical protein
MSSICNTQNFAYQHHKSEGESLNWDIRLLCLSRRHNTSGQEGGLEKVDRVRVRYAPVFGEEVLEDLARSSRYRIKDARGSLAARSQQQK